VAISTSIVVRIELDNAAIGFGEVVSAIHRAEGDVVAIDVITSSKARSTRDITINVSDQKHDNLIATVKQLPGVHVLHVSDRTFLAHLGGKIEIQPKSPIKNRDDLSRVYTPGVASVCLALAEDASKAFSLTIKRNTVAVISDGTAVLGLGDIGPYGAVPVMEGKAMLFKQLANVDAFPICLDTKNTEEIIDTIRRIAPVFGGINLEDISSPRCFEIEERLKEQLDIPVFHDDQHGTAIVILAGLYNALKIVGKSIDTIKVVVVGAGAAGVACCKMLLSAGVRHLIAVDRDGAIVEGTDYDYPMWSWLAKHTNREKAQGALSDVIPGADVFIGVSRPGVLRVGDIQKMAKDPIVFAMANPEPEIAPEEAEPYVRILATGRSDYPNQINNVLVFPGIFRGALDCRARQINEEMKVAAAMAIASVVKEEERNETYIVPSVFNEKVVEEIRKGVIRAAIQSGVAGRIPSDFR
jgi:malate dehydrogenase (oxaloacetate-decarboxylating)